MKQHLSSSTLLCIGDGCRLCSEPMSPPCVRMPRRSMAGYFDALLFRCPLISMPTYFRYPLISMPRIQSQMSMADTVGRPQLVRLDDAATEAAKYTHRSSGDGAAFWGEAKVPRGVLAKQSNLKTAYWNEKTVGEECKIGTLGQPPQPMRPMSHGSDWRLSCVESASVRTRQLVRVLLAYSIGAYGGSTWSKCPWSSS